MWELCSHRVLVVRLISWLTLLFNRRGNRRLERQQHIHDLLAIAWLLHIGDLTAAAIGDAGLRDFAGVNGVVALNVLRPYDTSHDQFADLVVDANLLLALDHEIAVRQ